MGSRRCRMVFSMTSVCTGMESSGVDVFTQNRTCSTQFQQLYADSYGRVLQLHLDQTIGYNGQFVGVRDTKEVSGGEGRGVSRIVLLTYTGGHLGLDFK